METYNGNSVHVKLEISDGVVYYDGDYTGSFYETHGVAFAEPDVQGCVLKLIAKRENVSEIVLTEDRHGNDYERRFEASNWKRYA